MEKQEGFPLISLTSWILWESAKGKKEEFFFFFPTWFDAKFDLWLDGRGCFRTVCNGSSALWERKQCCFVMEMAFW